MLLSITLLFTSLVTCARSFQVASFKYQSYDMPTEGVESLEFPILISNNITTTGWSLKFGFNIASKGPGATGSIGIEPNSNGGADVVFSLSEPNDNNGDRTSTKQSDSISSFVPKNKCKEESIKINGTEATKMTCRSPMQTYSPRQRYALLVGRDDSNHNIWRGYVTDRIGLLQEIGALELSSSGSFKGATIKDGHYGTLEYTDPAAKCGSLPYIKALYFRPVVHNPEHNVTIDRAALAKDCADGSFQSVIDVDLGVAMLVGSDSVH